MSPLEPRTHDHDELGAADRARPTTSHGPHSTRERATRLLVVAALTSAGVAACSLAVQSDRVQCATGLDCVGHGFAANVECRDQVCVERKVIDTDAGVDVVVPEDPIWGCLGKVPASPMPDKSAAVHYRVQFEGLLTGKALSGLPVKGCTLLDLACTQPIDGPRETDDEGVADVVLYHGFRGYLDIGKSFAHPDLMPSVLYALPIPDKNAVPQATPPLWNLLTKDEFAFAASSVGKELNPNYGHLFFAAVDCKGLSAVDTTARAETVTAETFTYYTDAAGTPSITQARTSTSGNGGFLNLPVGTVTVTLSRDSGARIGSNNIIIRPGTITYMLFGPTP